MQLSAGKNPPQQINVYIEIPAGGDVKYELDKESGILFVDRFTFTAMYYPFNYGFIPQTKAEDGDPVDVLVFSSKRVQPGTVIPARPVGLLEMEDEAGIDTKILAVPLAKVDPFLAEIKELEDVPVAVKNQIKHFFENYKTLEPGKWVKIRNWRGRSVAEEAIAKALVKES